MCFVQFLDIFHFISTPFHLIFKPNGLMCLKPLLPKLLIANEFFFICESKWNGKKILRMGWCVCVCAYNHWVVCVCVCGVCVCVCIVDRHFGFISKNHHVFKNGPLSTVGYNALQCFNVYWGGPSTLHITQWYMYTSELMVDFDMDLRNGEIWIHLKGTHKMHLYTVLITFIV